MAENPSIKNEEEMDKKEHMKKLSSKYFWWQLLFCSIAVQSSLYNGKCENEYECENWKCQIIFVKEKKTRAADSKSKSNNHIKRSDTRFLSHYVIRFQNDEAWNNRNVALEEVQNEIILRQSVDVCSARHQINARARAYHLLVIRFGPLGSCSKLALCDRSIRWTRITKTR